MITIVDIKPVACMLKADNWKRYAKMPERYHYAVLCDGWPISIHMTFSSAEEKANFENMKAAS